MTCPGRFLWLSLAALSAACGASLARPALTSHRPDDFIEVPYPPPAALVETVGPKPGATAVWVSGYWDWAPGQYVWLRGGWVAPPEGYHHAPWVSRYANDGRILFARTVWFDARGRRVPDPELVAPATTPPNYVTSEFQAPR